MFLLDLQGDVGVVLEGGTGGAGSCAGDGDCVSEDGSIGFGSCVDPCSAAQTEDRDEESQGDGEERGGAESGAASEDEE